MAKPHPKETFLVTCDTCNARVSATVEGSFQEYADEPGITVRYALLKCPECKTPLLAAQDDEDSAYTPGYNGQRWSNTTRLFPEDAKNQLGISVPEPIRRAHSEARSCFDHAQAYTACAIMCRKVLEGICESYGAKTGSLAQRLKVLSDHGELDKRLYEWITTLRVAGNEAAHDVNVTVPRDDARDLLDLTEAVAEYLYTFREKFEAFQKRRKVRSKSSAAPADSDDSDVDK